MSIASEVGLDQTQMETGQTFKINEIQAFYKSVDKEKSRKDVLEMIDLYPSWRRRTLDSFELGELDWYLDEDPNHVSRFLTQNGAKRKVSDVARVYIANRLKLQDTWNGAAKIEDMIKCLKAGQEMPSLIVIEGERYPNSPDSSFIDGVHRALAVVICNLISSGNDTHQSAFIGKKANVISRMMKRIGL